MRILKYFGFSKIIVLFLFWGNVALAIPTEYCGGTPNVTIDMNLLTPQDAIVAVQSALNKYSSYLDAVDDRYEICFEIINGEYIPVYAPTDPGLPILSFKPTKYSDNKPVVIYGIKLEQVESFSGSLLFVKYNGIAILDGYEVIKAQNALAATGRTQLILKNSELSGAGSMTEGVGVLLRGLEGPVVENTIIQQFGDGILIGSTSGARIGASSKDTYTLTANTIQNNGVGIKLMSGDRNSWPFNIISGNNVDPGNKTSDDGIFIYDDGDEQTPLPNEGLQPPEVVPREEKSIYCEETQSGEIIRMIDFQPMPQPGMIIFYEVDEFNQGKTYVNQCLLAPESPEDTVWTCTLGEFVNLQIDPDKCGKKGTYLTAIFTSDSGSSTMYMRNLIDLGDSGVVVFATGLTQPTDAPSDRLTGEVLEEDQEMGPLIDDQEMSRLAEAPAAPTGPALPIMPAGPGGGMCGASLIPYDAKTTIGTSLGAWWIIFSIALIASLRLQKARVTRRRKK